MHLGTLGRYMVHTLPVPLMLLILHYFCQAPDWRCIFGVARMMLKTGRPYRLLPATVCTHMES